MQYVKRITVGENCPEAMQELSHGVTAPTVQEALESLIVRMGHRTDLPSGINLINFSLLGKHHTLSHFDPRDHFSSH